MLSNETNTLLHEADKTIQLLETILFQLHTSLCADNNSINNLAWLVLDKSVKATNISNLKSDLGLIKVYGSDES